MKNKDIFPTYESARFRYDNLVAPEYGATRMEYGFGRWLWLETKSDKLEAWRDMDAAGILTADGRKHLARAEKAAKGGAK